jgi:hypothetical protein
MRQAQYKAQYQAQYQTKHQRSAPDPMRRSSISFAGSSQP